MSSDRSSSDGSLASFLPIAVADATDRRSFLQQFLPHAATALGNARLTAIIETADGFRCFDESGEETSRFCAGELDRELRMRAGERDLSVALESPGSVRGVLIVHQPAKGRLDDAIVKQAAHLADSLAFGLEYLRLDRGFKEALARQTRKSDLQLHSYKSALHQMAHDIRSPLSAVIMQIDLLLLNENDPLSARQRKSIDRIRESAVQLGDIATESLNSARMQEGALDVPADVVELHEVALETVDLLQPAAHARNVTVITSAVSPVRARGDRHRVRQVLTNVLGNAIKYVNEGGTVEVTTRLEDENAVVRVHDSGEGVSEAEVNEIFLPFVRSTRHQSREGSGLGLSIGRQLARLMGGELTLCADVTPGACFQFNLPAEVCEEVGTASI